MCDKNERKEKIWTADHDKFLESMADAAASVVEYFKGNMAFVNMMCNMSIDCEYELIEIN